jgi:hypothetical protein
MNRSLLLSIMRAVEDYDDYFFHKRNVANKLRLRCLQKVTVAFPMLCNGVPVDNTYEYI